MVAVPRIITSDETLVVGVDTDGDDIGDDEDTDDDNDGYTDEEEIENGTDPLMKLIRLLKIYQEKIHLLIR